MKKILITLDYDPSAQKVAEIGYEFGKAMNAEIKLLHVIEDAVYYSSLEYSPIMGFGGFGMPDMSQLPDETALKTAAISFLENTKTHLKDESIAIITEDGNAAQSIVKVAKEMDIDIIVMGSHSRSSLEKILMGSVTEKVLRFSIVPVLIVPTNN